MPLPTGLFLIAICILFLDADTKSRKSYNTMISFLFIGSADLIILFTPPFIFYRLLFLGLALWMFINAYAYFQDARKFKIEGDKSSEDGS